jgi:hypothetical protein
MRQDSSKYSIGGNDIPSFGNGGNNFAEVARPKNYFSNYQNYDNPNAYQFNQFNNSFKSDYDFGDSGFNRPVQQTSFNNYIDFKFSPNNGPMMNPRMKASATSQPKVKQFIYVAYYCYV